jgi:outer membrane lipoprotein-sorting protein
VTRPRRCWSWPLLSAALVAVSALRCQADSPLPTTAPAGISADLWQRMQSIDRAAADIADLTADFQQRKFTPLLKQPMLSGGSVWARGQVMLWNTRGPTPTVMRTDAAAVTLYYPQQKTAEVYPLSGQLARLAASPVPHLADLMKSFSFAPAPLSDWSTLTTNQTAADLQAFTLTPTDADIRQHVDTVNVLIDARHGYIVGFRLTDTDGETTELHFTNVKTNSAFDADRLELHLPADVKVVHPLQDLAPPQ